MTFLLKIKPKKEPTTRDRLETQFSSLSDGHRARLVSALFSVIRSRARRIKQYRQTYLYSICEAKTSLGTICHRRCQNILDDYCSMHIKNPSRYEHLEKKEKTPKAKPDFSQVNQNDYFEVQLKEIGGELVYVDQNGLMYRKSDYTIIGIIRDGGDVEKF